MEFQFAKPILIRTLLLSGILFLGYGLSAFVQGRLPGSAPVSMPVSLDTAATVLPEPIHLPAFRLRDQTGRSFTTENFRDHWSLLFFGYTHCPDICPTTLTTLNQTDKILLEAGVISRPTIVFISVDPERDTDEERAAYIAGFNPGFISVTGPEDQLLALGKPIGIAYQRETGSPARPDYQINHSAALLLIDPQARLRAILSPPHDAETIARDYQKIVSAFGDV